MKKKVQHYFDTFKTYSGVRHAIAIGCMIWGAFAFFTPFTPGALLFVVGFVMYYGKEEAGKKAKSLLGEKRYAAWKLDRFFEDNTNVHDI
jgi:hypothetical protein